SSRRRHTSSYGDWSSDVCSSDLLRKLALDPNDDPMKVGSDLELAVTCLRNLGRVDEIDDFREAVIAAHAKNWRLLKAAANSYAEIGRASCRERVWVSVGARAMRK